MAALCEPAPRRRRLLGSVITPNWMVGEAGRPGEYRKRCLTRMPRLNRTCVAHDARCKENSPEPYGLSVLAMAARPIGSLTGSKTDFVPRKKGYRSYDVSVHYRTFPFSHLPSAISSTTKFKDIRTSRTLRISNQTHSQTSSHKCEVSRTRTRAFHFSFSSSSSTPTRHNHSVQHLERIHVDCALICLNSTVHPSIVLQ